MEADSRKVESMIGTCLINPIMGHIRMTLTSPTFHPDLQISSRYEVNLHSFDSDLVAGLQYSPSRRVIQDARPYEGDNEGKMISFRVSWRHGAALSLASTYSSNLTMRFGVSSGPIGSSSHSNQSLPNPIVLWRSLRPCLGFEINYQT